MMLHDLMKEEHASSLRQVENASAAALENDANTPETGAEGIAPSATQSSSSGNPGAAANQNPA
jgi:hypothetical protein